MFDHVQDAEDFAAALDRVRRHAGLSYRRLAERAHYSHAHLVRATTGKDLPSWDVVAAFLSGCGVPADLLPVWHRRWHQASRGPEDVIRLLERTECTTELGHALMTLSRPHSLRTLEQLTGIPRATLGAWLQGTRLPRRDRLDQLVQALDASRAERTAVAEALARISTNRPTEQVGPAQRP